MKKKNVVILVDGENISTKYAILIIELSSRLGLITESKVYHRRKDPRTSKWTVVARSHKFKDICLCGGPEKDKVDHKMQKDARKYMRKPDVDVICIATSDGGFHFLAEEANQAGKKLYFI